jgi:hypothetical protein
MSKAEYPMVYILISDPIVSIIQRAPLKGKIQMQTRISIRKTFFERLHCFRYKQSIKEGVQKSSLAVFWDFKYNYCPLQPICPACQGVLAHY